MIRNIINLSIETINFMKLAACYSDHHYSRISTFDWLNGVLRLFLCYVLQGNAHHIINELLKNEFVYQSSLLQILSKSVKKLRSCMYLKFPLFLLWKVTYVCV